MRKSIMLFIIFSFVLCNFVYGAITYNAGTNLIILDDSAGAGDSWGTAYDMDDVVTNCGAVVTKQGANAYDVSARMQFNNGVYFVSTSEFVEVKPNPINPAWTWRVETGSHIRIGEYDSTDKFSYNGAFWRVYVASTTQAAGNYFKGETLIYGSNFWNDALNYQKAISFEPSGTTKIYNSIIQGISYMRTTDIDMQDVKWMYNAGASHGLMIASGYDYAWTEITTMDASSGAGGFFMSGTTTSAVDMYAVKFLGCARDVTLSGGCRYLLRLINSPTFSTISVPGSGKPGAKICYTFNVKVVNVTGAGIVGAVVRLKDVDGLTVFEESTVSGGVLATDEIVTKYWYRHTDDGGNKDFNDHTLRVSNGADVVEYVITIDHEIKEDIVLVPTPIASYDDLIKEIKLTNPLTISSVTSPFYSPNDEIVIYSTTTSRNGSLINSSVKINVTYPNGTELILGNSTQQSIGFHKYNFSLPNNSPTGTYPIKINAYSGDYETHEIISFYGGSKLNILFKKGTIIIKKFIGT